MLYNFVSRNYFEQIYNSKSGLVEQHRVLGDAYLVKIREFLVSCGFSLVDVGLGTTLISTNYGTEDFIVYDINNDHYLYFMLIDNNTSVGRFCHLFLQVFDDYEPDKPIVMQKNPVSVETYYWPKGDKRALRFFGFNVSFNYGDMHLIYTDNTFCVAIMNNEPIHSKTSTDYICYGRLNRYNTENDVFIRGSYATMDSTDSDKFVLPNFQDSAVCRLDVSDSGDSPVWAGESENWNDTEVNRIMQVYNGACEAGANYFFYSDSYSGLPTYFTNVFHEVNGVPELGDEYGKYFSESQRLRLSYYPTNFLCTSNNISLIMPYMIFYLRKPHVLHSWSCLGVSDTLNFIDMLYIQNGDIVTDYKDSSKKYLCFQTGSSRQDNYKKMGIAFRLE